MSRVTTCGSCLQARSISDAHFTFQSVAIVFTVLLKSSFSYTIASFNTYNFNVLITRDSERAAERELMSDVCMRKLANKGISSECRVVFMNIYVDAFNSLFHLCTHTQIPSIVYSFFSFHSLNHILITIFTHILLFMGLRHAKSHHRVSEWVSVESSRYELRRRV